MKIKDNDSELLALWNFLKVCAKEIIFITIVIAILFFSNHVYMLYAILIFAIILIGNFWISNNKRNNRISASIEKVTNTGFKISKQFELINYFKADDSQILLIDEENKRFGVLDYNGKTTQSEFVFWNYTQLVSFKLIDEDDTIVSARELLSNDFYSTFNAMKSRKGYTRVMFIQIATNDLDNAVKEFYVGFNFKRKPKKEQKEFYDFLDTILRTLADILKENASVDSLKKIN